LARRDDRSDARVAHGINREPKVEAGGKTGSASISDNAT
jgi:hypothetical protein